MASTAQIQAAADAIRETVWSLQRVMLPNDQALRTARNALRAADRAAQRDQLGHAQAAHRAELRTGRHRRRAPDPGPGMTRRPPPDPKIS